MRWRASPISSPLPCQLRLALRAKSDRYLRYLTKRGRMGGAIEMGRMDPTRQLFRCRYSDVAFRDRAYNARAPEPERHECSSACRSGISKALNGDLRRLQSRATSAYGVEPEEHARAKEKKRSRFRDRVRRLVSIRQSVHRKR